MLLFCNHCFYLFILICMPVTSTAHIRKETWLRKAANSKDFFASAAQATGSVQVILV